MKNQTTDLTEGSIRKHIINLATPAITGSLFATLYNVVDTFWAGKIGMQGSMADMLGGAGDVRALSGMGVTFPIFLVMLSLCIGLQSGAIALFGNVIGAKGAGSPQGKNSEDKSFNNNPAASPNDSQDKLLGTYLAQVLVYGTGISLLLFLILPLLPLLFKWLGVSDPVVADHAYQYISTIIMGNFIFCYGFGISAALIARGDTKTQRNTDIFNFFLNIVLNPLLLFGWGPIPAMGLRGIGIATLIANSCRLLVIYAKLRKYQAFAYISWQSFIPHWPTLAVIARQSLPPALSIAIISFLLGLVNRYANIYGGTAAVAAYGIALRIEQIALLPSIGLGTALTSIASQNNGARKIDRVTLAYREALLGGLLFLLLIMLPLGWLFPHFIVGLFTADAQTVEIATQYLAVCVVTFYAYMLNKSSDSIFLATQVPQYIIYISLMRNCVLPLVTFKLLSKTFGLGLNGLWFAIMLNNWLMAGVALLLCRYILRKARQAANAAQ